MKKIATLTLALFTILAIAQHKNDLAMVNSDATTISKDPTIVGVAAGNENFTTLVTAVKAADLVATLNSDGPFTVFAPTNNAFNKLPDGTVSSLLKPDAKKTLTGILTYHVLKGEYKAADVVAAIKKNNGKFMATTVEGGKITLSLDGDHVVITDEKGNASKVIMTDVGASNGVIHAIDTVIMPN